MFSLVCTWTNGWANHPDTSASRHHCAHYDPSVLLRIWYVIHVCYVSLAELSSVLVWLSVFFQLNLLNILRLRQNGQHCTDSIFKSILFNENVWIWIRISLKFVPINIFPASVQIMACHCPCDKPLPTHIRVTQPQQVKFVMNIMCFNFEEHKINIHSARDDKILPFPPDDLGSRPEALC